MNVKFLNPFVEAANEVLRAEAQATVTRGNLTLHKSALTTDEVTVLISLVGEVQGMVLYSMSASTALTVVSKIMAQEFAELDSLAQSGVAELGNVITGRASVKLSEAGFNSQISPPNLILGKDISVSTLDFSRIVVPLQCELGEITAHLALRESSPGEPDKNFVPMARAGVGEVSTVGEPAVMSGGRAQ